MTRPSMRSTVAFIITIPGKQESQIRIAGSLGNNHAGSKANSAFATNSAIVVCFNKQAQAGITQVFPAVVDRAGSLVMAAAPA